MKSSSEKQSRSINPLAPRQKYRKAERGRVFKLQHGIRPGPDMLQGKSCSGEGPVFLERNCYHPFNHKMKREINCLRILDILNTKGKKSRKLSSGAKDPGASLKEKVK